MFEINAILQLKCCYTLTVTILYIFDKNFKSANKHLRKGKFISVQDFSPWLLALGRQSHMNSNTNFTNISPLERYLQYSSDFAYFFFLSWAEQGNVVQQSHRAGQDMIEVERSMPTLPICKQLRCRILVAVEAL